jgi:uncharacterized protein
VKISVNQIPFEGLVLEETLSPRPLELETEAIKPRGDLKIKAVVSKITNAITIDADLFVPLHMQCSRCLAGIDIDFTKKFKLNYQVSSGQQTIDIDQDIREEIILDYPVNPLCRPDCKGLCPKCGGSLNEGGCTCGST